MAKKEPTELLVEREISSRTYFNGGKDIAVVLASSPLLQMLLFVVLIEILQQVEIKEGRPILTEFQANALQTAAVTAKGLEALGTGLSGVLGAINPLD